MRKIALTLALVLLCATFSQAGFWEKIQKTVQERTSSPSRQDDLSDQEVEKGLKETLIVALKRAVDRASQEGGFLNNPEIRIPPPPKVAKVTRVLRRVGLSSQVEAFEESMNRAAEQAAREAWPVFLETAKQMTWQDAQKLLRGGNHAITDYFREKTWSRLYERFLPVVQENLEKVGVTQKYQKLVSSPRVKPYLSYMGKTEDVELDRYVTNKALEGLFTLLAEEEERIRTDPKARTTELLKKLFGG